ncbi:MAG: peptide deformylase [Candidatus Tisiphia sp.]
MGIDLIVSNTKKVEDKECNSYFEQNISNELERKQNYFNQPCIEFPITDDNKILIDRIVKDMYESIKDCGIGLAHSQYPQQGNATNPYAVFIIEAQDVPFEAFINPVIAGHTTEKIGFYHGCLSEIGHDRAKMATYKEILVIFRNQNFQVQVKKYTDLASVICQHEFNHLTTKGTYVDAVKYHVHQHPESNEPSFYSTAEQVRLDERRYSFDLVGDEIPCLIPDYDLLKCPNYIKGYEAYEQALQLYLQEHSEDQLLYDNLLMSHQGKETLPLYGEVSHPESI